MKKLISTMVMLLVLMFALSTTVQAYTMSFTGKTEVESGETFSVTISVDEPTTLANGQLSYDSSLFTFVGATQTNMAAQAYPEEGKVRWMYTELVEEPVGVSAFTFTFKAAEVEETKKGTFTLNDFVVTTAEEAEYDQAANTISGINSVEVTINKKEDKPAEPTWTLNPSNDFELEVGDTKTIETDGDVTWTSSDPKVATVDKNGKVTAVKEGTVTITATDKDGNTKSVKVTVVAKDELTLSPSGDIKLEIGETQKVETNKEVTWTTSNSKVATVDKNGKITAVGAGTATITATDEDGNVKTIKVTVTKKDTTSGKKDNTTTPDKKLPQTGEDFTRFACLGIAAVILAAGLVFKKKAKNLGKLFVILPLVAIMSLSGAVNAIKIVDDETMKAGVFAKGELLEDKAVVAVSPCKNFTTENTLSVETLENLLNSDAQHIVSVVDSEGNEIGLEATVVPTGAVAWVSPIAGEDEVTTQVSEDYTVLLYGDANGDGKICNCLDVNVIRQDYVFNNKAEGVYKLAADLYADDVLNVRDVQRMVKKYLGTLDGSVVTPFPGEKEITLNPNDDFDLGKGDSQTITADTDVEWSWDEDSDVADVVVNDDGSITVTGKNPGEIDITATDENGNEKTITVTVVVAKLEIKDYTKTSVTVEATIEGKEIASVKHFYQLPYGYAEDNTWYEAKGTEAVYIYTNEELNDNTPYNLKAEITTTDGKVFETDMLQWLMGNIGPNPAITVTATTDEDTATIKTEVTNDVVVDQYSYKLQKVNNNGPYTDIGDAVRTTNPEHTFEGLEDGAYQVVVVASTNKGAYTTKFVDFTISTTKGVLEIVDFSPMSIVVEASIEGKEIASVKHFYRYEPDYTEDPVDAWTEVEGTSEARYTYLTDVLELTRPYEFKAEITTTDGKTYETNILDWIMGYAGETPAVTVTAEVDGNDVTATVEVTNLEEVEEVSSIKSYQYQLLSVGPSGAIPVKSETTDSTTYTFEDLEDGSYVVVAVVSTKNGLTGSDSTETLNISTLLPGETLDEAEAVAKLLPDERLFKTVQDAVNAIDESGTVQLLKDVEESFIVPETATGAILDLNGHTITAVNPEYTITNNGDLTIMNSNTSAIGQVTTPNVSGFNDVSMHTIITKGNLTITTNDDGTSLTQINLHPKADDDSTATIKNIGTNNTIKITGGATLGGSGNPTRYLNAAILDENTGSTIIVEKANIGGYIGIKKTGSGTINIGTNEQELWGTYTGPANPIKLSVGGTDEALLVDENVKVNFYNGYLSSARDQVSKNTDGSIHEFDTYRDGFGTTVGMCGSADRGSAYYREPFYTDNGETLDKEEAVAQLMTYPGGYYKTVEGAMQSAIDSGSMNGGTVKLLKSTTETVQQPQGSTFMLDLNGNTLTGEAGEEVTIGVVNGGLTITNSTGEGKVVSAETASVVANISLNNSALTLSPEEGTTLRVELKNSGSTRGIPNIAKGGSKDIVIEGNTYVVGPDYKADVYHTAIHDDGTGDIKIYSGVISSGTAIEKTSSGTIWIGYDYISGEVAERTELSISGTYGCLNVNEDCKVYYYDGYLHVTGVESASLDNGMVCINEKLDTDNDGYIDSYTVHEFDETRSNDTTVKLNGTASSYMTFYSVITTATVSESGAEAATAVLEAAQ